MNEQRLSFFLAAAAAIVFILLISFGITGSSLGWLKNYPGVNDIVELTGEHKLLGCYRGIRGDEFLNHGLPNALAQYHANPHFPRYNTNAGGNPRDLTVLHDTGAPVWHFVTLARPATWGFFIMDLRRAMAWYWWLPVMLGFFGIWFLLNELFSGQPFFHGLLSLSLTLSPICAAWSFWPLNNAGGLCIAAALFLRSIRCVKTWKCCLSEILIAWFTLCSVMTLYVPRIYPVMCLLCLVIIAYLWENKLFRMLKQPRIFLPLLVAFIICIVFVSAWVCDAFAAVNALSGTVYPGQRRLSGGTMDCWTVVKGWLAPLTVYKVEYSNQCELQGPLILWFPIMLLIWQYVKKNKQDVMCWMLGFALVWIYVYQIIGLPEWLCRLTFWDHCNPPRCDFTLAFIQILFLALLNRKGRDIRIPHPLLVSLWMMIPVILLLACAPEELFAGLLLVYPAKYTFIMLVMCLAVCWLCGWLLLRNSKAFIWVFCLISILPGMIFNPVCIAPTRIHNKLDKITEGQKDLKYGGKFLFLNQTNFPAIAAWASGARVFNGFYLYPDREMLQQLFSDQENPEVFNSMGNYDLIPQKMVVPKKIELTGSDRIRIYLSPADFDFSQWKVDFVAALRQERLSLDKNPSLRRIASSGESDFYRVIVSSGSGI